MYVPKSLKLLRLRDKGRALFAARKLGKGEVILRMSGVLTDDAHSWPEALQVDERTYLNSEHFHLDDYINHSCEPNAYWDFENMQVRALRNIFSGEEITLNYNTAEYDMINSATPTNFMCKCGSKNCICEVKGFRFLPKKEREKIKPLLAPYLRGKM